MSYLMQEATEMLERASMSLAQIRTELQRAGPSAQLQLLVMSEGGSERVHVTLQCDSYSDVMATSAQVSNQSRSTCLSML